MYSPEHFEKLKKADERRDKEDDADGLVKIIIQRNKEVLWSVTRERRCNGEKAVGFATLEETFAYVRGMSKAGKA